MSRIDEFHHADINRVGPDPYYNSYPSTSNNRGIWIAIGVIALITGIMLFMGSADGKRVSERLEAEQSTQATSTE